MIKSVFHFLFKIKGWKLAQPAPEASKHCIMLAAPHTSNWDFVYAISALEQLGLNPRFTIKKELNKFPIGFFISRMGAIWIDRKVDRKGVKQSMTEAMANLFKQSDEPLTVIVTAEGTRAKSSQWKTGFYYAALEAKVPICLSYMDYRTRTCGVGLCLMPSGNIADDMRTIMTFYKDKTGKYPGNFSLDERYI